MRVLLRVVLFCGVTLAGVAALRLLHRRQRSSKPVSDEEGQELFVRTFFGEEKAELLRGVKTALAALSRVLEGQPKSLISSDALQYPMLLNLSLVALAEKGGYYESLQALRVKEMPLPSEVNASRRPLDLKSALSYMRLASAAYGLVIMRALNLVTAAQARAAYESAKRPPGGAEEWDMALGVACHCPEASLQLVAGGQPGVPAHFVARLHARTVLCVRGTRSIDDALVDMVAGSCEAPELGEGCHAHAGIRAAAHRIVTGPAGRLLLDSEEDVVITGHSLGAACATLVAIELARNAPHKSFSCWSFAPPPIVTDRFKLPVNCEIVVVINASDCVPTLSLSSVAKLLIEAAKVDALPISHLERIRLIADQNFRAVVAHLETANKHNEASRLDDSHSELAPLRLLGSLYQLCGNEARSTSYQLFEFVRMHPRMLLDHFPQQYEHALASAAADA